MLADDQNRVHGQFVAAASKGLGNGRIDLEAELIGPLLALVALRLLVHIQRHHLHVALMPFAVQRIANQKPVAHVLGVGQIPVDGRDDRNSFRH